MSATNLWTEEKTQMLRDLFALGLSAGQIAGRMGPGYTRNSVIGKLHRSGLHRGPPLSTAHKEKIRNSRRTERRTVSLADVSTGAAVTLAKAAGAPPRIRLVSPPPAPEITGKVGLMDLTDTMCRWPIGTVGDEGFHFCGAEGASLAEGRSYCPHHAYAAISHLPKKRVGEFRVGPPVNVRLQRVVGGR